MSMLQVTVWAGVSACTVFLFGIRMVADMLFIGSIIVLVGLGLGLIAAIYYFRSPFVLGIKFPWSSLNYRHIQNRSTDLLYPLTNHKETDPLQYEIGNPINLVVGLACDMPGVTFKNVRLDLEFTSGPQLELIKIDAINGWLENSPNKALTFSFASQEINRSVWLNAGELPITLPSVGRYTVTCTISAIGLIGKAKTDYFCILMSAIHKNLDYVPMSYPAIGPVATASTGFPNQSTSPMISSSEGSPCF